MKEPPVLYCSVCNEDVTTKYGTVTIPHSRDGFDELTVEATVYYSCPLCDRELRRINTKTRDQDKRPD